MPDRLPSLILLAGFWVPPAVVGWMAADFLARNRQRSRTLVTSAALPAFVLAYAAAWFGLNLFAMPPYIPGATMDPSVATPQAVYGLAIFSASLILPGSALACTLAFRRRTSSPYPPHANG